MKSSSKLLEKHHQYLKNLNKESSEAVTQQQTTTAPVQNVNPFAKQTSTDSVPKDQMINANMNPQTSTSQLTTQVDVSKLQAFNCNPDFVRLTTGVFPQISGYSSVTFPLAAFIKPLGLNVR